MERRPLVRTGLSLSAVGLGSGTFGREINEDASFRVLDYAIEKGITFFDTAEGYGGGQAREYRKKHLGIDDVREVSGEFSSSERILGKWMKSRGCRREITVCTKVSSGGRPDIIGSALERSLERLQISHIDIYKMHQPDPYTPIGETLDALSNEIGGGRVRVIGCSNYSAVQLHEALDTSRSLGCSRFEVIQPPYSLAAPQAQEELFPLCRREGIAITPYSPLAAGFLTGKYVPDRSQIPRGTRFDIIPGHIDVYFSERNFRVLENLRGKAAAMDLPVVRLALAWAMTHPDVTSVLVGARTTAHIDNALAAFEMDLDLRTRTEMSAWN